MDEDVMDSMDLTSDIALEDEFWENITNEELIKTATENYGFRHDKEMFDVGHLHDLQMSIKVLKSRGFTVKRGESLLIEPPAFRRTWLTAGKEAGFKRESYMSAIEKLKWQEIPEGGTLEMPMMPGEAIKEAMKQLNIPRISAVAQTNVMAPYGVYAMKAHYKGGYALVYILDQGSMLTPVASDFYPSK